MKRKQCVFCKRKRSTKFVDVYETKTIILKNYCCVDVGFCNDYKLKKNKKK